MNAMAVKKKVDGMEPREIRAALLLADVTMKSIADDLGVTKSFVCHVVHGRNDTRYVRAAIAKAIGKPVSEVFGRRRATRVRRASRV